MKASASPSWKKPETKDLWKVGFSRWTRLLICLLDRAHSMELDTKPCFFGFLYIDLVTNSLPAA